MELDPAIADNLRAAIGVGLIHSGYADQDDDGEIDVFQWHHCFDHPACHGPTCKGCSGVPYLSDAIWNAAGKFGHLAKAFELHAAKVRAEVAEGIAQAIERHVVDYDWTAPAGTDPESVALYHAKRQFAAIARGYTQPAETPGQDRKDS